MFWRPKPSHYSDVKIILTLLTLLAKIRWRCLSTLTGSGTNFQTRNSSDTFNDLTKGILLLSDRQFSSLLKYSSSCIGLSHNIMQKCLPGTEIFWYSGPFLQCKLNIFHDTFLAIYCMCIIKEERGKELLLGMLFHVLRLNESCFFQAPLDDASSAFRLPVFETLWSLSCICQPLSCFSSTFKLLLLKQTRGQKGGELETAALRGPLPLL